MFDSLCPGDKLEYDSVFNKLLKEEDFEDCPWIDCENFLVEEFVLYDEVLILEESNTERPDKIEEVFIFRENVEYDIDGDNVDMISAKDSLLESDLSFEITLNDNDSILLEETFKQEDICRSSSDVIEDDFILRSWVNEDFFFLEEVFCSEESNWDLADVIEEDFFLFNSRDGDDKYDSDVDLTDTTLSSEKVLENDFIFEIMLGDFIWLEEDFCCENLFDAFEEDTLSMRTDTDVVSKDEYEFEFQDSVFAITDDFLEYVCDIGDSEISDDSAVDEITDNDKDFEDDPKYVFNFEDFEASEDADCKSLDGVEDNDFKYVFLDDDSKSGLNSDATDVVSEDVKSDDDILVDDFNEYLTNSDDDSWADITFEVLNDFISDFEALVETSDADFK